MPDKKVIRNYFAFQTSFTLLFWLPVFYEYQLKIGLTEDDIFQIQALYFIVFALVEIPTGWISDYKGYRTCLRWGSFILVLSNLIAIAFTNYNGIFLHFLLLAIARALSTGCAGAYLYEYTKDRGFSTQYKEIESRARYYALLFRVFSWFVVGYLMQVSIYLPYLLTAISASLAFYCAFQFPKIQIESVKRDVPLVHFTGKFLFQLLTRKKMLVSVLLGSVLFTLARMVYSYLYQPILKEDGIPIEYFGMILSVMTLAEAFASYQVKKVNQLWSGSLNYLVLGLTVLASLMLIPMALFGSMGTLLGMIGFALCFGLCMPFQRQVLNDSLEDSQYRVTFISFESVVNRLICAGVVSLSGVYVTSGRLQEFLILSGIVSWAFIVLIFLILKLEQVPRRLAQSS